MMELYICNHSDADFSHGICPDCMKKLYPDLYDSELEGDSPRNPA